MLLGLFLVGTLWFWVLLAVAALVVGICVARESFGKATLSVIATFALLGFLGDFNVLGWLRDNAATFAVYLVAYFAVGTAWSFGKWWFFVRRRRDEYEDRKRAFLLGHGRPSAIPMPDELKVEWKKTLEEEARYERRGKYPPRAREFKGKIMAWMMYWPWSLVVTLVDDPIRRLFNAIFQAIQGAFQRISDHAFRDIKQDLEVPPTSAPPPSGGNGSPKVPLTVIEDDVGGPRPPVA